MSSHQFREHHDIHDYPRPKTDHLLTPENSALVFIEYQPGLVDGTFSIEHDVLINNVVAMAKAAKMYDMPVVLSTMALRYR